MSTYSIETLKRFWSKVNIGSPNECWEWLAHKWPSGYGSFKFKGFDGRAHRFAYTATKGEIPAGLYICHKCNNTSCCNPNHLYAGTPKENSADMVASGRLRIPRHIPGVGSHLASLNIEQIREIRQSLREGLTQKSIARLFNVSKQTINNIATGKRYRDCL